MSNAWDVIVSTCSDCPMRSVDRCDAARWMPYLEDRRALDLSASMAGAPPPKGCPLGGGDMRIEISLARSAWRCSVCGRSRDACHGELEYARRLASRDWQGWRGTIAVCRESAGGEP